MNKYHKYPVTGLLILLACSAVFAQAPGKISGKVTYGGDNSALHNVVVRIVELKRMTSTDDNGNYQFTNVPSGRYTIVAHNEGFDDSSENVEIMTGSNATADFQMQISGVKENVTVTASGTEQSTFEAIESVSTVNSSQITNRSTVALGDVLNAEPGVAKRSYGPGNSRPVIRGQDGDRVLVSTDGIRGGSLASQSGDHAENVDIFAAERIEVVKGPATLLYGSNAIGGVVNAVSGHDEGAHPGVRGYFTGIAGTNNRQGAAAGGVEYGVKTWMFWTNASGQRTGDYTAGGDYGKVANSFTNNASGNLGGGYFGKKAFFTGNYNYYQSVYAIPLDFTDPESELRSARDWSNYEKFNFGYNDPNWAISGIKFTVNSSNYRHQELLEGEVGTTFRNKVLTYRGMFEQKPVGKLTGRFGLEGFRRKYETVGDETLVDGPVIQDVFSVFGLEELKFERVTLQFGGRIENNRYNPKNANLLDRKFTGLSGAVGARVDLWKGSVFVANYSHGYRTPAVEELYNFGPHDGTLSFEIGNPNMRPEISNGGDFSLRQQNKRFRAEANFFYYDFKDFVFLAPTGEIDEKTGLPITEYLQGNSRFTGTELSLDVTATDWLNVLTSLDYVSAQLKDGRALPRIAPLRGRFGLDAHYKNLSVRPEFVAVGDQDRVFTNETRTAGYGIFNIAGSYIISGKHSANIFSVSAYNLNNKLYFNHISFIKDISPEIGRGVRFNYTIRFF